MYNGKWKKCKYASYGTYPLYTTIHHMANIEERKVAPHTIFNEALIEADYPRCIDFGQSATLLLKNS